MIKFDDLKNGKFVNLIELDKSYLKDMYEYSKNKKLYDHFEFAPHKSINETENYYKKLEERNKMPTSHYYFIQHKSTMKVIGSIGIDDIDIRKMSCEISYAVSPIYWGKGIFSDTLNAILNNLFLDKNFNRVQATTSTNNVRSIQALKKFGFITEGILRDYYRSENLAYFDAQILGLLKKDYISKKIEIQS